MKKTLSMLLVLALVVALFAACGSTAAPASDAGSAAGSAAASAEAPADEGGEAAAPAAEPAAEAGSAVEDSAVEEAPEEEQLAGDPMEAMKEEFISYPLEEGGTISMWYYTPPYVQFVDSNANFNALKAAEEATGVKLDFIEVGSASASEQFNLMVAGGDMTDLIPVIEYYSSGVTKAYEEDVIMDIEPYVEEYMPNFAAVRECLSEKTQKQLMTDGALLAFYQVNDGSFAANGQVTRGDWLDELGISFDSTLISLDQFDDMLHQMHDKYNVAHTIYFTDGTLPLNAVFDTSIPTLVGDGFMTSVSSAIFRRGDECVSGWNQDGYRDYLEYVLQLMDDGLIDKDFMGLDGDQGVRNTAYANGDVAIWQMGADKLEELSWYTEDPNFKVAAVPNVTADPNAPYVWKQDSSLIQRGGFSLSTSCENPELVCQWENYFWTYDGWLLNNYGIEGESLTWEGEEPRFDWETPVTVTGMNAPNADMALELFTMKRFAGGYLDNDRLVPTFPESALNAVELWNVEGSDERYYPDSIVFTVEENEKIAEYEGDFLTYAPGAILAFLNGNTPLNDDTWNEFVTECDNLGINEIIAVYQNAYDEYIAGER